MVEDKKEEKVAVKTGAGVDKKDAEKADQDDVVRTPTYAENRLGAHQNFEEGRARQKKHAEEVAEKKRVERAENEEVRRQEEVVRKEELKKEAEKIEKNK